MKMEDELKTIVQPSTIKSKTRVVAPLQVTYFMKLRVIVPFKVLIIKRCFMSQLPEH